MRHTGDVSGGEWLRQSEDVLRRGAAAQGRAVRGSGDPTRESATGPQWSEGHSDAERRTYASREIRRCRPAAAD
jgi:hypothetical protein